MSNIKINDVFQRIQYAASAGQTQFTIPFPFFDNEYVLVWQNGVQLVMGGAPGQYGISGAGSPSGGLITLVTPATLNDIITIQGEMPIDRTSIYSATISNLTGSDLNGDFNREVVMMKQIQTTQALLQLQYAPWSVISQDPNVTKDRYLPLLGPQQVWRMNEPGTAIEAYTIDETPAPSSSPFVIYQADATLSNAQNLGALTSGILKQTVGGGSSTLSIAQNAVDYWAPGDALTRAQAPVNPNDVVNKTYADSIASGFTFINPVNAASTANFNSTYSNGSSGVGATLTATSNGAFSLDGQAGILNNAYLIKDQTNTFENGVYILTQVGDGSTPAILTRATYFDQPSEIQPGDLVPVLAGTVNGGTLWLQTATVTTVGTSPITFIAFLPAFSNIVTISGNQTITGDKTFTGTTILDNFVFVGNNIQHLGDTGNQIIFGAATQINTINNNTISDLSSSGLRLGAANARVSTILDEDDMASDSATALATQQSIKAYVDNFRASGAILQTISTNMTNTFSAALASGSGFVDITGFNVSITPSSTSNKVFIKADLLITSDTADIVVNVRLKRNGTPIDIGLSAGSRIQITTGSTNTKGDDGLQAVSFSYLDSPSSTSALTYQVDISQRTNSSAVGIGVNRSAVDADSTSYCRGASTITAQEIKG
ncbi:hypothetical protein ACF0MN_10915 [Legionella pneumophila]|uniref:hypothetical protein n=1 Tax=Legionella pneumophila TaxID=446 RepID=UPI0036F45578